MRSPPAPVAWGIVRVPTAGPRAFNRLALTTMVGLGLLIVSGGLVRLTGSGLGCPDWPSCARTSFVGALSFHKDIEFGNRLLSTAISVLVVVTLAAAFRLRPFRRDLVVPAMRLAAAIVVQIVIGGLVVLYHLWPPLVMFHFLVSEAMVAVAVFLYARSRLPEGGSLIPTVSTRFLALSRLLVAVTVVVIAIGTAVSGAGPHGGSRGVRRLPISFRGITELHATLAAFLAGLVLATLFATSIGDVPPTVIRRGQALLAAVIVQAGIGYTQYFLKVPAGLVALHLAGATTVLGAVLWFHLGLFTHRIDPAADGEAGLAGRATSRAARSGPPVIAHSARPTEAQSLM